MDRASDAVDTALRDNANASSEAGQRLQELGDSAATLADGRKVFLGKDGRLIAEDGTDVSDQRGSITGLSGKTPSWEDYQEAKARLEALRAEREAIERYRRDVLDPAKERLNDPDNPYSKEELEEAGQEAEEQMPEPVRSAYQANAPVIGARKPEKSAADEYTGSYSVPAPDVGTKFRSAHDGAAASQPGVAPLPDPTLKSTP